MMMKTLLLLCCLFLGLGLCGASPRVRYDGHSLLRVHIDPEAVSDFVERFPTLDIWSQTQNHMDVLVPPSRFLEVTKYLRGEKIEAVIGDVQKLIDEEANKPRSEWTTNAEFFEDFREYEEFLTYYDDLINQYPGLLSKNVIGSSYEGREIISLRLTTGGSTKPVIYIEATTHAREWLAPTTPLWILTTLLERYFAGDAIAAELVEGLEWHIVGFLNPDGYVYSWTNDRLWRKNRRRNTGSNFYGVDLNRNWGPNNTWGTAGSSTNPSSDTYCGTGAFSEPESLASSKAETALASRIAGLLAFHCYGPLLLRPYQYSYNQPPEPYNTEVTNLGADMEEAINAVHREGYESIQGSDLYPHSGGTIDWTYLEFGVPAFTIELRGNSFIVPASDIVLTGEENYEGVVVFAQHILAKAAVPK